MTARRLLAAALVLGALIAACDDATPNPTTTRPAETSTEPTATTADPMAGTPPTDAAIAANAAFNTVPNGTADCGAIVLTSGWPTTSLYVADSSSRCIATAAEDGAPAQQGFWGRDNRGGIEGTIIRVHGPGAITQIDYRIDPAGTVTGSTETACAQLDVPDFEPPSCSSN